MQQLTRSHDLVRQGDRVLAAVSGGPASAAMLACLAGMRTLETARPEVRSPAGCWSSASRSGGDVMALLPSILAAKSTGV